jgi:hypothetical protein
MRVQMQFNQSRSNLIDIQTSRDFYSFILLAFPVFYYS